MSWGGSFRLSDIAGFVTPELRDAAIQGLADRRRRDALAILEAANRV